MHLRSVDQTQQFEGEGQIVDDDLGQFAGAAAFQQCQMRHALGAAGLGRQHAHRAQAVQQQGQRSALLLGVGLEPAFQRALEGAGIAVALPLLAIGGAVDDGAQRLGHRARHGPGQAHDVRPEGRHAVDDLADVGLIQRRLAGQRLVQHQAQRQHIGGGGVAGGPQFIQRASTAVGLAPGHFHAQQAAVVVVVHQQHPGLQVLVRHAGFMGKGQALGDLRRPFGGFQRRQALAAQAFGPGDPGTSVIGHEGPAVLLANLDRRRQMRVVQPGGATHRLLPGHGRLRVGLSPGNGQHALVLTAGVLRQPHHAARALADQAQQLEAPEHAHRLGRAGGCGGRWRVGIGRIHDGFHRCNPIEPPASPDQSQKEQRNHAAFCTAHSPWAAPGLAPAGAGPLCQNLRDSVSRAGQRHDMAASAPSAHRSLPLGMPHEQRTDQAHLRRFV